MTWPNTNVFDDDILIDIQDRQFIQQVRWGNSKVENDAPLPPVKGNTLALPPVPTDQTVDPPTLGPTDRTDEGGGEGFMRTAADVFGGVFTGTAKAINASAKLATDIGNSIVSLNKPTVSRADLLKELGLDEETHIPGLPGPPSEPFFIPTTPRVTTAGRVTESITQFMVGFYGLGKVAPFLKAGQAVRSTIPSIGEMSFTSLLNPFNARNIVRGAGADAIFFNGQEENLANFVQSIPELQNPITEFLANDADTPEMDGRLHNVITGIFAGMGVDVAAKAIGGLVQGVKALKSFRQVARQTEEGQDWLNRFLQEDIARIQNRKLDEQIKALVGDPNAPVIAIRTQAENKALVEAQRGEVAFAPGARQRLSEEHASQFTEGMQVPPLQNVSVNETIISPRVGREYKTTFEGETIRHPVSFDTVTDRLAFVATSNTRKAIKEEARQTLYKAGWDDAQIDKIGAHIRGVFEETTKSKNISTRMRVEPTAQRLFGEQAEDFFQVPGDVTVSAITRIPIGKGLDIDFNFAPFRFAENMEQGMRNMLDTFQKSPEIKTWITAAAKAGELNQLQALYKRSPDEILNDENMIGLAALTKASVIRINAFAQLVKQPNATDAVRQEFAASVMMHTFISNQWSKAGTEAGRALAARRRMIPDEEVTQQFRNMQASLATVKGAENLELIADTILHATRSNDLVPAQMMLRKLEESRFDHKVMNTVREIWTNFILSGVKTFATNAMSPITTAAYTIGTRGFGRGWGEMVDAAGDKIAPGEAAETLYAWWKSVPEAWTVAMKAFVDGGLDSKYSYLSSRNTVDALQDRGMVRRVSADYWNLPTWSEVSSSGNAAEEVMGMLGTGMNWFGSAINLVYKTQASTDYFWKVSIYRSEIHAQAYRKAYNEVQTGSITPGQLDSRLQELTDPNNLTKDQIVQASEHASRMTFTNDPDKFSRLLTRARDMEGAIPNPTFLVLPFINTPANIIKYGFTNMPVIGLLSSRVRQNLAAGGPEAQTEIAKMGMGTLMVMNSLDMVYQGNISGRGPVRNEERQALVRQGWQPYSVKIGDTWVQYNRFEPMGMLLGVMADFAEIGMRSEEQADKKDFLELGGAIVLAATNSILNRTYFSGLFELSQAIQDPVRYGDGWVHRMIASLAVPNIAQSARRTIDPGMSDIGNTLDAVWDRMFSAGLPQRHDLWGRPMTYDKGMTRFNPLMPFEMSHAGNPEPIDQEMSRQGFYFDMPGKQFNAPGVRGVKLNLDNQREAYQRYVQLAGNDFVHPTYGLGAKDLLNQIVDGSHPLSREYMRRSDGKGGEKHKMIQQIITEYRNGARNQLVSEFPYLVDDAASTSIDLVRPR